MLGRDNPVLVLSNIDSNTDTTFDSDIGTWNVSRAIRDCKAGKHKQWGFCIDELIPAIQNVEVDQDKVRLFASKYKPLLAAPPIILIVERGVLFVIDGHHRIHAYKRAGIKRIIGFVIEECDSAPYQVWYNGQRLPPWAKEG